MSENKEEKEKKKKTTEASETYWLVILDTGECQCVYTKDLCPVDILGCEEASKVPPMSICRFSAYWDELGSLAERASPNQLANIVINILGFNYDATGGYGIRGHLIIGTPTGHPICPDDLGFLTCLIKDCQAHVSSPDAIRIIWSHYCMLRVRKFVPVRIPITTKKPSDIILSSRQNEKKVSRML